SYRAQFTGAGGTPPYTWSLISGTLPPGLALGADGLLAGTPTALGAFTFTVALTDSLSASVTAAFTVNVYLLTAPPPVGGPWKILYGPAQPAGSAAGEIVQAQATTVTLRTDPDLADQVDLDINGLDLPAGAITELATDLFALYGAQVVFNGRAGA